MRKKLAKLIEPTSVLENTDIGQTRPIVIVLGMHRSGTSLCSHVLSALGVDMADQAPGRGLTKFGTDNQKGHWERWEIVDMHDRILALVNRGYYTALHDFPFPVAWWTDPRIAEIRREIVGFLEKKMGRGAFGFKDPRTIRLLPMWEQIFAELKLVPKVIFCLRNPGQVARSLKTRDNIDLAIGEGRWFTYITDFFYHMTDAEFCTIEYESWFDDYSHNLIKLYNFLDMRPDRGQPNLEMAVSRLVDRGLRNDDPAYQEPMQPLVRSIYQLARRAGDDASAREEIKFLTSQFVAFQGLQQPFYSAVETNTLFAINPPGLEENRRIAQSASHQRAIPTEAHLSEEPTQFEAQTTQIAEVTTTHSEREAALAAAIAELDATRAGAAATESDRQALEIALGEREAAFAAVVAEMEGARAAVAETESARQALEVGPLRELWGLFSYAYDTLGARHQIPSIAASLDDTYNCYTPSLFSMILAAAQIANENGIDVLDVRDGPGERYYKVWPGEHYRLLYGICKVINPKLIIEIGTSTGMSAAAMLCGMPDTCHLVTFDIMAWKDFGSSWLNDDDFNSGRIIQQICDLGDESKFAEFAAEFAMADFIFIDGPKNITFENNLLKYISEQNSKQSRFVMFDDIKGPLMDRFWREIRHPKFDITSFGHWSGTGIIELAASD